LAAFSIAIVLLSISLVGLTETIVSQENLGNHTDSTSHKNAEARGQCIGNVVSSPFAILVCVISMIAINTSN
jgi:MFS superfamily sulfate permease-like transporter